MVKEQPNQTASLISDNNDAVTYLQMGQLDESYSLLSEAVATLQNMIREQSPPQSSPVLRYNFRWIDLTHSNANHVFESSDQSSMPFLFQRCISVDMPRRREFRANTLCPFGLFPILHYNLALVAHFLGIQRAEYGKLYLQEADRLYGVVSADLPWRRSSADCTVLLMGIWNNQGCIYMELGMEEQAIQRFDLLRKLLMSTRASINRLPGWRHFYLNLAILGTRRSVAAAA
jgi:tetratricopeptide (TPR) repeat protein